MSTTAQKGNSYVREALDEMGLSVADLARLSGIKYGTLMPCVLGYRPASPRTREATAQALDLDPDYLWGPDESDDD